MLIGVKLDAQSVAAWLLGWTILGVFLTALSTAGMIGSHEAIRPVNLALSFLGVYIWGALSPLVGGLVRELPAGKNWWRLVAVHAAASVLFSAAQFTIRAAIAWQFGIIDHARFVSLASYL